MKILFLGSLSHGSTAKMRFDVLKALGHEMTAVDVDRMIPSGRGIRRALWSAQTRMGAGPFYRQVKSRIRAGILDSSKPDLLWIDAMYAVPKGLLSEARDRWGCRSLVFSPDSIQAPGHGTAGVRDTIANCDIFVTTKPQDLETIDRLITGRRVFALQGFSRDVHGRATVETRPSPDWHLAFVGQFDRRRDRWLAHVRRSLGIRIAAFGPGWASNGEAKRAGVEVGPPVYGSDYVDTIRSARLSVAFLNRAVGDVFTTRTFELPAMGQLLVGESTAFHHALFRNGEEAAYFEDLDGFTSEVESLLRAGDDEIRRRASRAHYRLGCLRATWFEIVKEVVEAFETGEIPGRPTYDLNGVPTSRGEREALHLIRTGQRFDVSL